MIGCSPARLCVGKNRIGGSASCETLFVQQRLRSASHSTSDGTLSGTRILHCSEQTEQIEQISRWHKNSFATAPAGTHWIHIPKPSQFRRCERRAASFVGYRRPQRLLVEAGLLGCVPNLCLLEMARSVRKYCRFNEMHSR